MNTTQKTEEAIVDALCQAYRQCRNKANGIRKAAYILQRAGVEVNHHEVSDASDPADNAGDYFRQELKKRGWVEGRMGQFEKEEAPTAAL